VSHAKLITQKMIIHSAADAHNITPFGAFVALKEALDGSFFWDLPSVADVKIAA
jgi:hypothetical protein